MRSVALDYPAHQQPDGSVWFWAADGGGGWTADPAQAHPDYQVKIGDDGSAVTWVGDPWGVDSTIVLPPVADADLPSITVAGQRVDWPALDNALSEGYTDADQVATIAQRLVEHDLCGCKASNWQTETMEQCSLHRPTITTTKGTPMTDDQFDEAAEEPRFTTYSRYPLPPAPPRAKVTYDGYGRYKLPSPSTGRPTGFTRATTISKTLEETYNLNRWSRRQAIKAIVAAVNAQNNVQAAQGNADAFDVADGEATPLTLLAAIREAIEQDDDRKLDAAVDLLDNITGGADARELGEAVHAWLEAVDIGTVLPWQVPAQFQPYVVAARDALRRAGLVACPQYVERIVLNDRGAETVVGTIDRIYRVVTTGELVMGDVKTSKTLEYSWLPYSVQVGGVYGYATKMFRADGDTSQGQYGWEPMPEIGSTYAVILHVPSDQPERSAVVTIDMYFGGESMVESLSVRKRRKDAKTAVPQHAVPVPSKAALRWLAARDAVLDTTDPATLAGLYESYEDVWTDDLTELGMHVAQLIDAAAPATV